MPLEFPGGYGYQSPSLPPQYAYPTPFPMELGPLGPLAFQALKTTGILPPGLANMSFSPTTDLFTQFQAVQQFQMRTQAMQQAQTADVATLMRYQESFARASGADWSQLQGRAKTASQWIGSMLPTLAMVMPEAIDTAMGPRGSQVVMASQLANASRYMFDPNSGRMGMSANEVGSFSDQLYKNLYGSDASTAQMRGIGAGRAGILMNEMLARGLISSPFGGSEAGGMANLAAGGAMSGMGTIGNRIGTAGTNQTADQIRGMTKIISSIQDMFGANGQPNAPIPELLNALDQLGKGMEYKYSAGQVESTFRTLQQATITGKISLPQMSQMINQNAAALQAVGADPRDAIALTGRSVNYASAASAVFNSPFYGRMDPRTLAMTSASLETAGVNSPSGQMAQIALFLADSSSGLAGGSEFSQLATAIRSGATTYGGGKSVLEALQGGNLRSLYTAAGGNVNNFNAASMNPEVAARYSNVTSSLTRKMQFDEISNMTSTFMAGDMSEIFGIGNDGQRIAAGNALVKSLFKNAGAFAGMTPQAQAAEIERLAAEAAAGATGGNVADFRKMASGRGAGLLASMSGAMTTFSGFDLPGALQAFSPEAMAGGARLDASNRVGAAISSAMGDMGRFSLSQRLAHELQNLDPKGSLGDSISRVLGGVDKKAINSALSNKSATGKTLEEELRATLGNLKAGDPGAEDKLRDIMKGFSTGLANQGIFLDKISDNLLTAENAVGHAASGLGMVGIAGFLGTKNSAVNPNAVGGNKAVSKALEIAISGTLELLGDGKVGLKGHSAAEGASTGKEKK